MELPKILIVSRLVWDDASNSNTLSNIFKNYDPDRIARIYIETKQPNTKCCHRFFQISEFSLIKKLYKWRLKTGRVIDTHYNPTTTQDTVIDDTAKKESQTFNFVRSHRSPLFTIFREILWGLNGWKSKELRTFIEEFDPDIVWLDGSPLILMNRLNNYVSKVAKKPIVTFLMDDVYTYKSCTSIWSRIYKFFLRHNVKKTVDCSQHVFVASPKMKDEYDKIFNINSTFITKSIDKELKYNQKKQDNKVVKLVYLGNVLIGRINTLCMIAESISKINTDGIKIQLDIYTGDYITQHHRDKLDVPGVYIHGLVPYSQVPEINLNSDVQVFVEAISGKQKDIARLSFSTKIIDYIASGKCIFAVGSQNIAPIEYFKNEDAALIATTQEEIDECIMKLLTPGIIEVFANKAIECGRRNHNREKMDDLIFSKLNEVVANKRN